MKKRVIYYSLVPSDSTAFWRTTAVFPYLQSDEFELIDSSLTVNFNWTFFVGVSVFILQRPFTQDHCNLLILAKDMGVRIIIDLDDDLYNVTQDNPTYQMYEHHKNTFAQCIGLSDELWVSTKSIGESCNHPNTHIIPNAHNDYLFPVKQKRPFTRNRKVMYRGGGSHQGDVMEVADQFVKTINEHLNWIFIFCGDRFTYIEQRTKDNHHIVTGMNIMQYFRYLHRENPSIMVFPLCNTKFNHGKSNISFIEGSYAGAAFFGNTALPEFKDVAYNLGELPNFLNDTMSSELERMNKNSWELICDTLLLSKVNEKRKERILANI